MRALILVAVSAVAISACNKGGTVENTTNIDQVLASQNISANDTTAIDAATGDDANMAADVQFTTNVSSNDNDNASHNSN